MNALPRGANALPHQRRRSLELTTTAGTSDLPLYANVQITCRGTSRMLSRGRQITANDAVATQAAPREVINESPSDDRTDRVTHRWHLDPCRAATTELYRRDLSDHHRSRRPVRQRQLSPAIGLSRVQAPLKDRAQPPAPRH